MVRIKERFESGQYQSTTDAENEFRRLVESDLACILATIGEGRKILSVPKNGTIYSQGAACDAVFYIQTGKVKLTVISKSGKEATVGILNSGDFFGEGGLAGQPLRMGSATAMTACELMRIEKNA